ncbi:hypothetical protein BTA51_05995 [Hahella sp. CCB-MM4]|uniref:hypothetical protein n=1 Tax=Hahella sp. (strain CCB-MM4) TaxID=1926491 RepID=UPI000B9B0222|nr:hypothetical protein [Hahella sp. CCB-MM4]OZG74547.1 hypothetical protein BTA51_05995 [Hahella sp. CCB-MM4]
MKLKTLNRIFTLGLLTSATLVHGQPITEDPITATINTGDSEMVINSQYDNLGAFEFSKTIAGNHAEITNARIFDNAYFEAASGSKIETVYANENSDIKVAAGSEIKAVLAGDNSTTTVQTGSNVTTISGYKQSTIDVFGGDISWLQLYGQSSANLFYADDLSWLVLNDDSQVNIYGKEFNYSDGHLSGVWENGESFSFWAVENVLLPDSAMPEGINFHYVSEPASLALLTVGILLLRRNRRGKLCS